MRSPGPCPPTTPSGPRSSSRCTADESAARPASALRVLRLEVGQALLYLVLLVDQVLLDLRAVVARDDAEVRGVLDDVRGQHQEPGDDPLVLEGAQVERGQLMVQLEGVARGRL